MTYPMRYELDGGKSWITLFDDEELAIIKKAEERALKDGYSNKPENLRAYVYKRRNEQRKKEFEKESWTSSDLEDRFERFRKIWESRDTESLDKRYIKRLCGLFDQWIEEIDCIPSGLI